MKGVASMPPPLSCGWVARYKKHLRIATSCEKKLGDAQIAYKLLCNRVPIGYRIDNKQQK
jgi:hypothetical protein